MIKRGLVVGVKGFPRTGEAFNTILYSIKKSSDTGGVLYEKNAACFISADCCFFLLRC